MRRLARWLALAGLIVLLGVVLHAAGVAAARTGGTLGTNALSACTYCHRRSLDSSSPPVASIRLVMADPFAVGTKTPPAIAGGASRMR